MQVASSKKTVFKTEYAILLAMLILAINLTVALGMPDSFQKRTILNFFSIFCDGLAVYLLYLAGKSSEKSSYRLSKAWYLISLGQLSYAIGDICWAFIELILKQNPFPSLADAWYLASYPLFILGTVYLSHRVHSQLDWGKRLLDLGIVVVAALLGYWNFLIGPLTEVTQSESILARWFIIAYPIFDLGLLTAIFWLINSDSRSHVRLPILILVASSFMLILTDTLFAYQTLMGTYVSGQLTDCGWLMASLLLGLAGYSQIYAQSHTNGKLDQEPIQLSVDVGWLKFTSYLPYVALIFAFSLLAPWLNQFIHVSNQWIYAGVTLIGMLVVVRQVVAIEENRWLNKRLETLLGHVQKQASILEETNKELQSEIVVRQKVEEQLSYEALHDALTNLPNRTLFTDRLEKAIEESKNDPSVRYSVLFMDIDQFKSINDSLGHSIGDDLLVVIAQRLKESLRSSDTAARLGGDEFVILLENHSSSSREETISFIVNRVQDQVQQQVELDSHTIFFTTSIGIVLDVANYYSPSEVLRDADIAMYRAKALGKDRYEIFTEELRAADFTHADLEEGLQYALKNRQFELHYQPIIRLDTSELIGFESFIRWNHPIYGTLYPNDFIPLAEEKNLMQEIGKWVLFESSHQTREWQEKHPERKNLIVHVNIAGKQFSQPKFADMIENALDESGLSARSLKLEITEAVLIENFLTNADKLELLNELGVQIEIDNFGTGFSSLAYIQNFPIHIIKIDRSFVKDLGKKRKVSELVRAIISMAHDLGMETVAEGIESVEQLAELKRLGCDYGQGFYISDPLSTTLATALLNGATSLFSKPNA